MVCGAEATVLDDLNKTKIKLGRLLVGRLSVASGSVRGVPYCDEHKDSNAVSLDIQDDTLRVVFSDYEMLQRYLAVNTDFSETGAILRDKPMA